jgi:hypothetical protein
MSPEIDKIIKSRQGCRIVKRDKREKNNTHDAKQMGIKQHRRKSEITQYKHTTEKMPNATEQTALLD